MRRFLVMGAAVVVGGFLMGIACEAEAGSRRSRPVRTGQTTCWNTVGVVVNCVATGQDGELQRGERRAYQDNGDGTIRDLRTALMWEKLSDDGSIHDNGNNYTWANAFAVKIATLNTPPCFAWFCDWRLPNLFELETLRNVGTVNPAVSAAFNSNCGASSGGNPGCTVLTCSCNIPGFYWSSSSYAYTPQDAWFVRFSDADIGTFSKGSGMYVRAVRGGS